MRFRTVTSVIFLVLFVITLPAAFLISDLSLQLLREQQLNQLLMENVLSDQALPQRVREAIWFQSWYGTDGLDAGPRMLITGIQNQEMVEILKLVLPEETRRELLTASTGGLFDWLKSENAYPEITLDLEPALTHLESNLEPAAAWALDTFKVPGCSEERTAQLVQGEYGKDLTALISCRPPKEYRDGVAQAAVPLIGAALEEAQPPREIDLSERLRGNLEDSRVLAIKGRLNTARRLLPLSWVLPLLLFGFALAFRVRSLEDLIHWSRWPLTLAGVLGLFLVWWMGGASALVERILMPPVGIPAPAAPVLMVLFNALLSRAGSLLGVQMGITLILGLGLLIYSYQEELDRILRSCSRQVQGWLQIKTGQGAKSS